MSILKKNISVGNLKTKHLFLFKNYLGSQYGFRNKRLDEYLFGVIIKNDRLFYVIINDNIIKFIRCFGLLNIFKSSK